MFFGGDVSGSDISCSVLHSSSGYYVLFTQSRLLYLFEAAQGDAVGLLHSLREFGLEMPYSLGKIARRCQKLAGLLNPAVTKRRVATLYLRLLFAGTNFSDFSSVEKNR